MKVDDILRKEMPVIRNEMTDKNNRAVGCRNPAVSEKNDRVSISSLINNLNHSVTSNEVDQARTDRVTTLKTLIETGKYNISGQQVAAKMLSIVKK